MPAITLSHRAILRALLEAGGPVYVSDLAKAGGITASHITVAMSAVRAAIKPHGARLKTYGSHETLRYYVAADDLEPLHAVAAVPEGRAWFHGFSDADALILRRIVEAGGQPVLVADIVTATYAKPYFYRQAHVVRVVGKIRERLAAQGSEQTILSRGRMGALAYAWGPVTDDVEEVLVGERGITLPSVGGAYHYAAGRLMLDGQPAGRAA